MNMIEYQTVCKIHNNELHTLTRLLQRHILMLAVDRTTVAADLTVAWKSGAEILVGWRPFVISRAHIGCQVCVGIVSTLEIMRG